MLPKGYSLRVAPPQGAERVVHVFDAAGEVFASRERTQELRYLRIARTFLFVVDPLSVESFWRSLAEHERRGLDAARRPTQPPDFVFHQTANHLERIGVKTDRARLAVAISKTDLVGTLSMTRTARRGCWCWPPAPSPWPRWSCCSPTRSPDGDRS